MKSKRTFHAPTLSKNNKTILLAGGRTGNNITSNSKYLNVPRFFHTTNFIPSTGNVLMCGGVYSNKKILNSFLQLFFYNLAF